MQKIILIFICTLSFSQLIGQKLNTKDFDVESRYLLLPAIGLDPAFNTYQVTVNGNAASLSKYEYTLNDAKKTIALDGYHPVPGGGSVIVEVTLGAPTASKLEMLTEDKQNKEGVKWKEYSYFHDVGISSSYKVKDYRGNTIDEKAVAENERISTSKYRSYEELKAAYNREYPAALNDKLRSMLYANVQGIRNSLNYNYGFTPRTMKVNFETLHEKAHPDLAKYDKIKSTVEKAFTLLTPEDNSAFITAIQPAIDFWVAEEKKYDPQNKDERKMNYAMRMNLAKAYYWTGDFDNAATYLSKITQGDVSPNTGKSMMEELNKFKATLKKLNRPGQNFKLVATDEEKSRSASFESEREALYAKGDVRQFEEFDSKMGVTPSSRVEPATMFYKNGKTDEGYMVYEAVYPVPDFRQPQYIRFGKADGRSVVVNTLDYTAIDSMRIKGQIFYVRDVILNAGIIKPELKNAILEYVRDYNRSTLVIVHPPFMYAKGLLGGGGEPLEPGIVIFHKKRNEYIVPDDIMGFTKGMTRIVEDCPAAVEYLKANKGKVPGPPREERLRRFTDTEQMIESLALYDDCGK